MTCSLCSKTAWYQAGKKYFCGDHREEAKDAAIALGTRKNATVKGSAA